MSWERVPPATHPLYALVCPTCKAGRWQFCEEHPRGARFICLVPHPARFAAVGLDVATYSHDAPVVAPRRRPSSIATPPAPSARSSGDAASPTAASPTAERRRRTATAQRPLFRFDD